MKLFTSTLLPRCKKIVLSKTYFRAIDFMVSINELSLIKKSVNEFKTGKESEISLVAITVSTGYSDLLEYLVPKNLKYFDNWLFVTDIDDLKTQEILARFPQVEVILFSFKTVGRIFNKGKAIRKAQKVAYKKYPKSWYLLLDSDILLSQEFSTMREVLPHLKSDILYGCKKRLDFNKMSNLKNVEKFYLYQHMNEIHGYFQLHKLKYLYRDSIDASWCDLQFSNHFENKILLDFFSCYHLGVKGNWTGRKSIDFIFD